MNEVDKFQQLSLRERKKARTRAAIQREALRLFRKQGYNATTIEQICEAAEVSASTFFRYFGNKEDVVLWDEFDPQLIDAFRAQPAATPAVRALRNAMQTVFSGLAEAQLEEQRERTQLIFSVPELRKAALDQFVEMTRLVAELFAEREGRRADELPIRNLAGAVLGVMLAVALSMADNPEADMLQLIDAGLAHLEAGLPL